MVKTQDFGYSQMTAEILDTHRWLQGLADGCRDSQMAAGTRKQLQGLVNGRRDSQTAAETSRWSQGLAEGPRD